MYNEDWDDDIDDNFEEIIKAYEALKRGEHIRFIDADDFELLIEHFFQNNQEQEALIACDMALEYFPLATTIMLSKAEILFEGQKYGQAIQILDRIELEDPLMHSAIILRSEVLVAQLKAQEAVKFLESKIKDFKGKEKVELLLQLSDVYDECEDYEGIFNVLSEVLQIEPRNDEALHKISFWSDFAGFQEKSVALFTQLIDEDPYNAIAWFNLGVAYQGLKKHKDAIEAYEYCIAIDENFEFAYRNLAEAYMRLKWYEKAIECLQKNIELGKPEDVIFEAIGLCYDRQKEYEKARSYYRKAIQLNPADGELYYKIGETYFKEQDYEKAAKSFGAAIHLNKEIPAFHVALANTLLELGAEPDQIIANFLIALELKPQSKMIWLSYLKAMYRMELFEELEADLDEMDDLFEQNGDFLYIRVAALFKQGKVKEGTNMLMKALSEAPQKLKVLLALEPDIIQRSAVANLIAAHKRMYKKGNQNTDNVTENE